MLLELITEPQQEFIAMFVAFGLLMALSYAIFYIYIPIQNAKNKRKQQDQQAAKERDEIDRIFDEAPTGFIRSHQQSIKSLR